MVDRLLYSIQYYSIEHKKPILKFSEYKRIRSKIAILLYVWDKTGCPITIIQIGFCVERNVFFVLCPTSGARVDLISKKIPYFTQRTIHTSILSSNNSNMVVPYYETMCDKQDVVSK